MLKDWKLSRTKRRASLEGKLLLSGRRVRCYFDGNMYLIPFSDFKKIPDEEKLNAWKGLLKGKLMSHTTLYYSTLTFLSLPDRNRQFDEEV